MTQPKILHLQAVGGSAFNMLKDGSVRAFINPNNAERFKHELLRAVGEIDKFLIGEAEAARAIETTRYVVPKTRMQELEEELARLKGSAVPVPLQLQPPAPSTFTIPVAIAGFNEDEARAKTIIRGGFEPDDGQLVRPVGATL
jgi:hypothetical protein